VQVRSYITFKTNSRALSFQWLLAVLMCTARAVISERSVLVPTQGLGTLNPSDSKTGLPYGSGSSTVLLAEILEVVTPQLFFGKHIFTFHAAYVWLVSLMSIFVTTFSEGAQL